MQVENFEYFGFVNLTPAYLIMLELISGTIMITSQSLHYCLYNIPLPHRKKGCSDLICVSAYKHFQIHCMKIAIYLVNNPIYRATDFLAKLSRRSLRLTFLTQLVQPYNWEQMLPRIHINIPCKYQNINQCIMNFHYREYYRCWFCPFKDQGNHSSFSTTQNLTWSLWFTMLSL